MSKIIMVQGTMSGVGKSFIVAGLCRAFNNAGYRTAPFKSQNMALNSGVTDSGEEMGRAQVMQAEAARVEPSVLMNPILLKPVSDIGSQVIVNGRSIGNMSASGYFGYKKELIPVIRTAFSNLEKENDIIVIEGAGSPAEINLKENDIVNMGLAKMTGAPVLLAGDIDRGGVFAQLYGTLLLLDPEERALVKGMIINKFRGDKAILRPGLGMIEDKCRVPVTGVLPLENIILDDEDSLTDRFAAGGRVRDKAAADIAVVRLPHISNFTDFNIFDECSQANIRYVRSAEEIGLPDMIIIPGSKNTIGDLKWMRSCGIEKIIKQLSIEKNTPIMGICGGYQMIGCSISDPEDEEEGGAVTGMSLIPVDTVMSEEKKLCRSSGKIGKLSGIFSSLEGLEYEGYEIHMGITSSEKEGFSPEKQAVICSDNSNVYGTYIHGFFDKKEITQCVIAALLSAKGVLPFHEDQIMDYGAFRESQYDKLSKLITDNLDMDAVYGMLRESLI